MFRNIKVGDLVIAHSYGGFPRTLNKYSLCRVTKVNKITFKVDRYPHKTFEKDYGLIYRGLGCIRIVEFDAEFYEKKVLEQKEEEQKEEELRKNLLNKAKTFDYTQLTTTQLEQMFIIAEKTQTQES